MGLEDVASEAVLRVAGGARMDAVTRAKIATGLGGHSWTPSRNIQKLCQAARLGDAVLCGDGREVHAGLDWWRWATGEPLMQGEDYTPHHSYHVWHLGPTTVAADFALDAGDATVAEACRIDARAQLALSALCCCGPGRVIRDHGSVEAHTRLVHGDGAVIAGPPFVALPGKRGWVRGGDGRRGPFMGLEDRVEGHALCRAARMPADRRHSSWLHDLLIAQAAGHPHSNPLGIAPAEAALLRKHIDDHTAVDRVRTLLSWIGGARAPEKTLHVVCYQDGSLAAWLAQAGGSSTGTLAAVGWEARTLRCWWASWDYGLRDNSGHRDNVTAGRVVENGSQLLVQSTERQEAAQVVELPQIPVLWRARVDGTFCGLIEPEIEPVENDPPPSPEPESGKRFPWGDFL